MDDIFVECVECDVSERFHPRDACTPIESNGRQVYLCAHHAMRYRCDLCGCIEYSAECRGTHWCLACSQRMERVAEDIIADYEGRAV